MYYKQVFLSHLTYHDGKAAEKHTNIKIGDVCLLHYANKVTKGDYRMCLVRDVFPDKHGVVRDVLVAMAPCNKKAALLPYKSKQLVELRTSMQRLLLLPILPEADGDDMAADVQEQPAEDPVVTEVSN